MNLRPRVALVGPLNVKGVEYTFALEALEKHGCHVLILDTSTVDIDNQQATPFPNLNRQFEHLPSKQIIEPAQIFHNSGLKEKRFSDLDRQNRNQAMQSGVLTILKHIKSRDEVHAIAAFGGSQTTSLVTAVMRDSSFEIGMPKVVVTTMMAGDIKGYVGESDIVCWPSIVDISGTLNSISSLILSNACSAIAALSKTYLQRCIRLENSTMAVKPRPHVALSMFGLTTPCITEACRLLSQSGYEPVVFHASGLGGRGMERLIHERHFKAVLDITTTELADDLMDGILSAGPSRLTAAATAGIPQLISVGALDMCNFGPSESVPLRYTDSSLKRKFHRHNESVTLLRTNVEESFELGKRLASKANLSRGPFKILFPKLGISGIDCKGGQFEDIKAREALLEGINSVLGSSNTALEVVEMHINDAEFANKAVSELLNLMKDTS